MNLLDLILIVPLIWGFYRGFQHGFIIEVATLVAFGLGIFGAIKFSDFVTVFCQAQFGWHTEYLPIISFVITFIGIAFLVYLIAKAIEQFIRLAALGMVNRISGGIFGGLKFALAVSCVLFVLQSFEFRKRIIPVRQQETSFLYVHVAAIAPIVIPAFEQSKLNTIGDNFTTMK